MTRDGTSPDQTSFPAHLEKRRDEEFWRVAIASIGDAVILVDGQGQVSFMNPVAEQLCGWSAAEALGKRLSDIFQVIHEQTRLPIENPADKAIRERTIVRLASRTVLLRRGKGESPIDDSAAPIINEKGDISGAVLVFRDVSEQREAQEAREQLAAIVESSDDIILSKDLNGIIKAWNQGAERVLGYSAEEVIGKHVSLLIPPEHIEDTHKILGKIAQGARIDHYETKRRRKDGQIIDVSLTVSPIRNSYGEIVGASKVGRDITKNRQLHELHERLAAIVASSDDIIISKDLNGIITSWNKGAERLLGYRADEVVGKHIAILMPPEFPEDFTKILRKVSRGEAVSHYETKRKRKDGRVIDVSLTVSPIRDPNGKIVGASKIGRDISQQKLIEAERRESERRKDEFLAMLAHELRNPMASISNAVQLLGRLESQDELDWVKDVVQRQVKHLVRLIDDLLDVSRITRGKIELRKEMVDLSVAIANSVDATSSIFAEQNHELRVIVRDELKVYADPVRLDQMLVNLLTNAAKYTDAGGFIELSAHRENSDAVIRVRDNGIGIPADLVPKIFELFVQGDQPSARTAGGLGIGLTLVQKIAAMHGGTISVYSEGIGKGSEFTLRLPASNGEASTVASIGEQELSTTKARRILVVDDNYDTAESMAKILQLMGHSVRTAGDGSSAIAAANELRPEFVLLDIGLPGMDGYEVARRLRMEACCKNAVIVAVSGYGQEEDRRRSRDAGFDDHMVKPVDYRALLELLERKNIP